jgi:hypothetical protein
MPFILDTSSVSRHLSSKQNKTKNALKLLLETSRSSAEVQGTAVVQNLSDMLGVE